MPMFEAPFDDAVAALRIGLGADYDRLSQEGALMDVVDLLEFAIAALRPLWLKGEPRRPRHLDGAGPIVEQQW